MTGSFPVADHLRCLAAACSAILTDTPFLVAAFWDRTLAPLLGDDPSQWTQGRLTYQLRRMRLHGLIERVPGSTRYVVTERGITVALWFSRCQARLFRPALGELLAEEYPEDGPLRRALDHFDRQVDRYLEKAKVPPAA
jgi:hypothetical protein